MKNITRSALGLTLALAILCTGTVRAADADIPTITITTVDHAFEAPAQAPAGFVSVAIENEGHHPHHVQLARLRDGVSVEQFQQALQAGLEEVVKIVNWVGGPSVVGHGLSSTVTLQLEPGTHMLLCFIEDENRVPHLAHGMIGVMEVVPTDAAASEPPQADLRVDMLDFAYAFEQGITAGPQIWEIVNNGDEIHELSLIRLAEGATMEAVGHWMHTMEGPPPFDAIGGLQAVDPGMTGWLHLDLTPGEYVAICHIPDLASGQTHADMGMIMPFVVE